MRAVVMTDELVEAAWKFTVKSVRMGSVTGNHIVAEKAGRLSFNQRVQLAISVCFGMFFCTLMLFVLCAFDDPAGAGSRGRWIIEDRNIPRRILQSWNSRPDAHGGGQWNLRTEGHRPIAALHGMGVLFRRGSRAMNELIVAHLTENASESEVRIFLRTLHRSGAMARADLVLLFPKYCSLRNDIVSAVIEAENLSYRKLSACLISKEFAGQHCASWTSSGTVSVFNAPAFRRAAEEASRKRNIHIHGRREVPCEGSIMGFGMEELDPDNVLSAFVEDPPAQLRRWVCYQMLLGLLRHRIRNVMLVRIGAAVVLSDALASLRNTNGSNLLLLMVESRSWDMAAYDDESYRELRSSRGNSQRYDHGRRYAGQDVIISSKGGGKSKRKLKSQPATKEALLEAVYGAEVWNSLDGEEDRRRRLVSSGIILGTVAPLRGLCNAMVNEVIRVTLEKKSRERFPDQIPLSYLVHRSSILGRRVMDNLQLLENRRRSFVYTMAGTNRTVDDVFVDTTKYSVVDGLSDRGRWASAAEIINRDLCNSPQATALYPDCAQSARVISFR